MKERYLHVLREAVEAEKPTVAFNTVKRRVPFDGHLHVWNSSADEFVDTFTDAMDSIAKRTPADRLAEWEALNAAIAEMEAEGVRRRHPKYGEREVFLALVRHRYGDTLYCAAWPGQPLLAP